jgi:hypothetical protein
VGSFVELVASGLKGVERVAARRDLAAAEVRFHAFISCVEYYQLQTVNGFVANTSEAAYACSNRCSPLWYVSVTRDNVLHINKCMHACMQAIWTEVCKTFQLCLHAPPSAVSPVDTSREPHALSHSHLPDAAQTAHWEPIEEEVLTCITDTVLASKVRTHVVP